LSSSPSRQKILHRLVYFTSSDVCPADGSAAPVKIVRFEIILAEPGRGSTNSVDQRPGQNQETSGDTDKGLGVTLRDLQPPPTQGVVDSKLLDFDAAPGPRCWAGVQASVCMMMPDRPLDMRFLVQDLAVVPRGSEPPELQQYLVDLKYFLEQEGNEIEQPEPPAYLTFAGEIYELNSTTSVRQSIDTTQPTDPSQSPESTQILRENLFDLESNQKSVVCKVDCKDAVSEGGWANFMKDCDNLTAFMRPNSQLQSSGLHDIDQL